MIRCSVLGCKSNSEQKPPNVSFHSFPDTSDGDLLQKWIKATHRTNWIPKKYSKICGLHFAEKNIFKRRGMTYLMPDAVPISRYISAMDSSGDVPMVTNDPTSSPRNKTDVPKESMKPVNSSNIFKPKPKDPRANLELQVRLTDFKVTAGDLKSKTTMIKTESPIAKNGTTKVKSRPRKRFTRSRFTRSSITNRSMDVSDNDSDNEIRGNDENDHNMECHATRSPVQKKSHLKPAQKPLTDSTVMDSYEETAIKIIEKLKERDTRLSKEVQRLDRLVRKQKSTIANLRGLSGPRRDSDTLTDEDADLSKKRRKYSTEDVHATENDGASTDHIDIEKEIKANTVLRPGTKALVIVDSKTSVTSPQTKCATAKQVLRPGTEGPVIVDVCGNYTSPASPQKSSDTAKPVLRPDTKAPVIGYVCEKVKKKPSTSHPSYDITQTPSAAETGDQLKKRPYLNKQELRLRLVTNKADEPMYEIVSDDETDCEDEINQQNTALPKGRKLDNEYWKSKLSHILHNRQFCGVCLDADEDMNILTDDFEIIVNGATHTKKLTDIVGVVFKETESILSNSRICNGCTTNLIQSYIFIENTKETSKMLNYHLNQLYDKACYIRNNVLDDSKPSDLRNVLLSLDNTDRKQIEIKVNSNKQEKSISKAPLHKRYNLPSVFKCMECNIFLTSFEEWNTHKTQHELKHKCRICQEAFKTSKMLTDHFAIHFQTKCRICQGLVQDGGILAHLKKCHKNSIYLCSTCNVVFYTSVALNDHIVLWHKGGETKCLTCLRSYTELELNVHKCRFRCPECLEVPCVHHKYLMSYREQILNLADIAKCPDCHYVTTNKGALISHASSEHLKKKIK